MSALLGRRPILEAICIVVLLAPMLATTPGCEPRDPLERARRMQEDRDFAGSLEILRGLVEERPENAEVQFRYGIALASTGEKSLAMWPLRKAAEDPAWLVRAGIPLAHTAIELGRWEEAIEACSRILEQQPDHVETLILRAHAHVRSRRANEAALEDVERVLELEPDNTAALVPKTAALLALKRVDEAAAALEQLESLYRDESLGLHASPTLCAAQATFRKEKGEPEAAAERFDTCLEHFPGDGAVIREAVAFFDAEGRGDRSEQILQRALEEAPDSFPLRSNLFQRLRASGRKEAAEALLREATQLEAPASAAQGWSALALYQIETGAFEAAAASFERARDLDPGNSQEVLFGYADALVVAGRYDDALRVAETLSIPAHRMLVRGRVALERGNPEQALVDFDQANQLWPNNAVARYYTAVAAEQLGRFGRAVEDYRYSMRIDVRATDAYLRLARMQRAAGRDEAALNALYFQPGERPGEDEADLLQIELLAKLGRPTPRALLQQLMRSPGRRGAVAAAAARGLRARPEDGPARAVAFLRAHEELDLTDPRQAEALAELVDALAANGEADEGAARVEAALASHPESAVFHALRGDTLARGGEDTSRVRAAYERALELDAEEPRALRGLARLEAERGERTTALALYERAVEANANDAASVRAAAALLVELGRTGEAEARLDTLLRARPYDADTALDLAALHLEHDGKVEAARELARRAAAFGGGAEAEAMLERTKAERETPKPDAPEAG